MPPPCPPHFNVVLYSAYVISIVTAMANPANFNYEHAYTLAQGANVTTLLILSYCKQSLGDAFMAAVLGVAFAFRTTGSWAGGSRWDALLVFVGMVLVLQDGFYHVIPKTVPHRFLLYLGFTCLIMPVLSSLPYLAQPPRVEPDVLARAAVLSRAAYGAIPQSGETHTALHDGGTGTDAGVVRVRRDGEDTWDMFVYFRGSESGQDWKTNANILDAVVPADWGCATPATMRVHKGYFKAFDAVAAQMHEVLASSVRGSGTRRVVFCGHSLGGALATIAATYASCKFPELRPNIALITFGSPQVGDGNFVAFFNDTVPTSVRVVNPFDPVPRLLSPQMVHVKGFYPAATFSLESVFNAHDMDRYVQAVSSSRATSLLAVFTPAAAVAVAIAVYVSWQLRRQR